MKKVIQNRNEYFFEQVDDAVKGLKDAINTGNRTKGWASYFRLKNITYKAAYVLLPDDVDDENELPVIK